MSEKEIHISHQIVTLENAPEEGFVRVIIWDATDDGCKFLSDVMEGTLEQAKKLYKKNYEKVIGTKWAEVVKVWRKSNK